MRRRSAALRCLAAGLLAAGCGLTALSGQRAGDLGQVLRVRQIVKVRDGAGERTLRRGEPIQLGQTIRTGPKSAIEMSFDGDGRLLLWPSTRVILQEPGPPAERHPTCRNLPVAAKIDLRGGSLQVDHDPDPKRAVLNPRVLEVVTPDARICLFGTSIQVLAYRDLGTGVFVRETGARVQHLGDDVSGDWLELKAGFQTFVREGEKLEAERAEQLSLPRLEGESRFLDSPLFDPIVF